MSSYDPREPEHDFGDQRYLADADVPIVSEWFDPHGPCVYMLWGDTQDYPLHVGSSEVHNVCARIGKHVAYWQKMRKPYGYDPATLFPKVEIMRCRDDRHMMSLEADLNDYYRPPIHKEIDDLWVPFIRRRRRL